MADSSEKAFLPNNPGSADTNPLVPFVDLKAQYQTIKSEIEAAISRVVESGRYILGPEVEKFRFTFSPPTRRSVIEQATFQKRKNNRSACCHCRCSRN